MSATVGKVVRWLFATGGSLRARAVRGGLWLMVGDALTHVLALAKVVILSRLLSSYDFGLFGAGLIALVWVEHFATSGVSAALIRQPGDVRPYLDTAWTIQLLRGIGLAVLAYTGAPLVASLFADPHATAVVRALAALPLIRGLRNPAVVLMSRELDFRRLVSWNLSETVTGLVAAILLGLASGNVWALVGSVLLGEAAKTVTSYWIVRYRPRLRLEARRFHELARFGQWVFVYRLSRAWAQTIDGLLVGRLLGTTALGLYQMAGRVAFLPTHEIGALASRVMLPAFTKVDRPDLLREAFTRALHVAASVTVPVGVLLTVFAKPILGTVLGASWEASASVLLVIVWCGVARALSGVTAPLFHAVGQPDVPAKASVAGGLFAAATLYPLIRTLGMVGAAAGALGGALLSVAVELSLAFRLLRVPRRQMLHSFRTGVAGSLPFLAGALPVVALHSPHWLVTLGAACALYSVLLLAAFRSYVRMVTGAESLGGAGS